MESSEPSASNEERLATPHKLTVMARAQARSGGEGRYPCAHLDMHPLQLEAGSNLLNSKLTYIASHIISDYLQSLTPK